MLESPRVNKMYAILSSHRHTHQKTCWSNPTERSRERQTELLCRFLSVCTLYLIFLKVYLCWYLGNQARVGSYICSWVWGCGLEKKLNSGISWRQLKKSFFNKKNAPCYLGSCSKYSYRTYKNEYSKSTQSKENEPSNSYRIQVKWMKFSLIIKQGVSENMLSELKASVRNKKWACDPLMGVRGVRSGSDCRGPLRGEHWFLKLFPNVCTYKAEHES